MPTPRSGHRHVPHRATSLHGRRGHAARSGDAAALELVDDPDEVRVALVDAGRDQRVDVYFENVGGSIFRTVLPLLTRFARVPFCGPIGQAGISEFPGPAGCLGSCERS